MALKSNFDNFLVENKLLTAEGLTAAQAEANSRKLTLQQVLVEKRLLTTEVIAQSLAKFHSVEYRPGPLRFDPELVSRFPLFSLRRYRIIPLEKDDKQVIIAASDPANLLAADEARRITKLAVKIVCATDEAVNEALSRYQANASAALGANAHAPLGANPSSTGSSSPSSSAATPTSNPAQAPGAKRDEVSVAGATSQAEQIIDRCVQRLASDVHIEPQAGFGIIRERIDGILHEVQRIPLDQLWPIVSRLKLLCGMDVVEKRLAQDGRFKLKHSTGVTELRGSILPTIHGEKMVLRILRSDRGDPTLDLLEIGAARKKMLQDICDLPDGLVIVAGPTGSGKSTTLYAMLNSIDRRGQNIITVEDPVEYELQFANQVQVNQKIGITFASTLPTILRQDPDVVLIGEVRDEPTAQMVMRTAISGHLVFSTLHAPNALSTVIRLVDMNVETHMLVAALKATISQRLLRKLCPKCKKGYEPNPVERSFLKLKPEEKVQVFASVGCEACHGLGYSGRFVAIEILMLSETLYEMIARKERKGLLEVAQSEGFKTMHQHGLERVLAGDTSIKELLSHIPERS